MGKIARNGGMTFAAAICTGVIGAYATFPYSLWAIGLLSIIFGVLVAAGFED